MCSRSKTKKQKTHTLKQTVPLSAKGKHYSLLLSRSSGLLSSENGGIRQSNVCPSSRSKRNVPLRHTSRMKNRFSQLNARQKKTLTTCDHWVPATTHDCCTEKRVVFGSTPALDRSHHDRVPFPMCRKAKIFASASHATVRSVRRDFPTGWNIATNTAMRLAYLDVPYRMVSQ